MRRNVTHQTLLVRVQSGASRRETYLEVRDLQHLPGSAQRRSELRWPAVGSEACRHLVGPGLLGSDLVASMLGDPGRGPPTCPETIDERHRVGPARFGQLQLGPGQRVAQGGLPATSHW